MELTRRFVFKAYASALSGQIYVPSTNPVDVECGSSALGVAGGRARSEMKGGRFGGDAVRVESATTLCEGRFDDEKRAKLVVSHKARQEELTSTTRTSSELKGLSVGNNKGPFFTARRIRASLVSRSPAGSGEPRIAPEDDTVIEGAAINEYGLTITLNLSLFQTCDTRSKLVASADDPKVTRSSARNLVLNSRVAGQPGSGRPELVSSQDTIYTTVVKDIKWRGGREYPGARIDEHSVIVPDFGRIFFGELLVSPSERRLTMVRFDLGSPLRGYVSGGDASSNGGWFP
jgi:hypothetical protein